MFSFFYNIKHLFSDQVTNIRKKALETDICTKQYALVIKDKMNLLNGNCVVKSNVGFYYTRIVIQNIDLTIIFYTNKNIRKINSQIVN